MSSKVFSIPATKYKRMWGVFKKRKVIIPMIQDMMKGNYKVSSWTLITFIFSLVYLISPADLIPDFILVAGWLDDLVVVSFASKFLNQELERYLLHQQSVQQGDKPIILSQKWK